LCSSVQSIQRLHRCLERNALKPSHSFAIRESLTVPVSISRRQGCLHSTRNNRWPLPSRFLFLPSRPSSFDCWSQV
jgi:hypothetical protein